MLVVDNTSVDNSEIFSKELLSRCIFVAHNADHEATWGAVTGFLPMRYVCTMVNDKRLLSGQLGFRFDIISLIRRRLGIQYVPKWMNKDVRARFETCTFFDDELINYNASDTLVLKDILLVQLQEAELLQQYYLHNTLNSRIVKAIAKAEMTGIKHNSEEWIRIAKEREAKANLLIKDLDQVLISSGLDLSLIVPEVKKKKERLERRIVRDEVRRLKLSTLLANYEAKNKTHLKAYKIAHEQYEQIITTPELAETDTGSVNWGSQKQVLEVFRQLEIPIPEAKDQKTHKMKEGLGKNARANWFVTYTAHPVMDRFDKYKKLIHNVVSFGESWVTKFVRENGRVYTVLRQADTDTGRFASGNKKAGLYQAQNIPQGEEYRHCFIADDGRAIVTADYRNQEGVMMISLSGDLNMKKITDLDDQHSYLGGLCWRNVYKYRYEKTGDLKWLELSQNYEMNQSIPEKKKERSLFKNSGGLFPVAYGVTANKVAASAGINEREAQVMIDTIKSQIPLVIIYLDSKSREASTNGYVIHNKRTGSRRWFTPVLDHIKYGFPLTKSDIVEAEMQARNSAIQGSGSDLVKEAICMIDLWATLFKQDLRILITVHDEIVLDCPEDKVEFYAEKVEQLMKRAAKNYLIKEIDMEVEVKVGKTWQK